MIKHSKKKNLQIFDSCSFSYIHHIMPLYHKQVIKGIGLWNTDLLRSILTRV